MKKIVETIWQYKLLLGTKFMEALGILMLLYELFSLIFKPDSLENASLRIWIFSILVLLSVSYALLTVFHKKEKLTISINKRTEMTIEKGDILNAPGLRVIPVNEFFDTHLGDGIIKETSIHGQFLTQYKDRIPEVQKLINEQLAKINPLPSNRTRNMVAGLPQNRYPLGTCIRLIIDKHCYLWVATTRFNSNEHVEVSAEEFPEVIRKMFNGIEQLHDGNAVYLPLIGSGIAGYELTNMQILNTIIQSAHNANKLSLTNGLYLYLYDDRQISSINLNVIKFLYDRWVTLK